ncbi:DUF4328 domain-containing protein [Streptomyces sp. NPDC058653]|uniref:protein kinase domain-containing protein n=1 Tax=Streptomyces sp. NPDC058653 TaxID=3346576 RepID=UPI003658BD33
MDGSQRHKSVWIGRYQLIRRLGEGGMGQVYLARSTRGRTVAVKVVKEELARKPDFRRRFAQEVQAARLVGGEWTAPVLDADTDAPTPWVATGFIAGPSLNEVVGEQYGPLPLNSLRSLAIGLIHALRAIHGAGLVHRDLKPSNVLVTVDGPRVIDFGIARALDVAAQSADELTRTGAIVGTPGFMSPEQVRGERVTYASDIFCLGAVLAYTATGRQPFGSAEGGLHALLFRIAESEADTAGIPEPWQSLIAACLAKDPSQRPSLDDLLARVEETPDPGGAWLPGEVLAALGRQAVKVLDEEDPEEFELAGITTAPGPTDGPGFGPPVPSAPPASPSQSPPPAGVGRNSPPAAVGTVPQDGPYGPPPLPSNPPPSTPPSPRTARSADGLATALSVLLGLSVLPLLYRFVVIGEVRSQLGDVPSHFPTAYIKDFEDLRSATRAAEVGTVLVGVAVVIMWSLWFRRTRINAEAFAPGRIRHPAGMAVGSWFTPLVNLYMPKQISNDIWTATTGRPAGAQRWLLHTWWWLWLAHMAAYLNDSVGDWHESDAAGDALDTVTASQVAGVVGVLSAVVALAFVTRLTSLQKARIGGDA